MNCPYLIYFLLPDGDIHAVLDDVQPVMIGLVNLAFWFKRKWWGGEAQS